MALARRNGDRFWFPRLPNCIGWIYRELQDFDHALEWDRRGVDIAREYLVVEAEANSLINLACDYSHLGEDENTLQAFRDVEACLEHDEWFRWRYKLHFQAAESEHWLCRGDLDRAAPHAQRLLEAATRHGVPKYVAIAHKLLAEIAMARGELADAAVKLAAALDILHSYPAPLVAWKTYAVLGRLRRQMGDGESARGAFAQAAGVVGEIAANIHEEGLRGIFLNSTAVREVFDGANACSPGAET